MTDDIYGHLSSRLANMPKIAKGYTQDCFGKPYKSRTAILEIKRMIRNFLVTSKFPNRILVIPGLRGVGKTTLLFQIYNYIVSEERVPSDRVLSISMEQAATVNATIQSIVTAYEERVLGRRIESVEDKIFLLVDEAHYDSNWAESIIALHNKSQPNANVFIIVTGSSSLALTSNKDIDRRAIFTFLPPLTLQEHLVFEKDIYPEKGTMSAVREAIFSSKTASEAAGKLIDAHRSIYKKLSMSSPINSILERYLSVGGFPYSAGLDQPVVFDKIYRMIDKISREDLPEYSDLGRNWAERVALLRVLAASKPGNRQSYQSMATAVGDKTDKMKVFRIFEALKKSGFVIISQPYGSIVGGVRIGPKINFATPNLRAAIMWNVGKYAPTEDVLGQLLEDAVAAVLYRSITVYRKGQGLLFDENDGGADFIIRAPNGLIPIECKWGEGEGGQVKKTMKRIGHESPYGIVVCSSKEIIANEDLLFLPKELFLFM